MAGKKKESADRTFEESLHRLEEIVEKLESGGVPLEESIKLYEEGITLAKACTERLTQAELTIKRLGKDVEGMFTLLEDEPDR